MAATAPSDEPRDTEHFMLPLPVREGWAPLEDWTTPRRTFNEHGRRELRDWLEIFYPTRTPITPEANSVIRTFLLQNDDALRTTGPRLGSSRSAVDALLYQLEQEDRQETLLHLIDFTLRHLCSGSERTPTEQRRALSSIFEASRSVWRVAVLKVDADGNHFFGLQQEVSPTANSAAHLASSGPKKRAGEHLRLAWSKLYGVHTDPSGAYWHAVKSVEAAAAKTLAPNDQSATLGKLMTHLREGRSNYEVRLNGDKHNDSRDTIHHLMGMIWRSEFDRHGTDDLEVPLAVSGEEAESAVFAAVMLVQYFQAGHLRRVKD